MASKQSSKTSFEKALGQALGRDWVATPLAPALMEAAAREWVATPLAPALMEAAASQFQPAVRLTVAEWADRHRVLTRVSAGEPGPWRTDRTPFLREIMEALTPGNDIERVVLMKGTQIGGTECGNCFLGFIMHHQPGPVMFVNPTLERAKQASRQRIAPMIEASPALRALGMREKGAGAANSVFAKDFPGGTLAMVGAQSASALRAMPVRYLFLDEVDAYEQDVEHEGSPIDLALRRTDTFHTRKKVYFCSTPRLRQTSNIEPLFLASDQRWFHVPCPRCNHPQPLKWPQIKWAKGADGLADRDVWLECAACQGRVEESSKSAMLAAGQWVPQATSSDPALRGYHLNSLYSPAGWLSWRHIVQEFLEAKRELERRNFEKMKTWVNTRLAETWDAGRGEEVLPEALMSHRAAYDQVPDEAFVLTAGVDIQKDRLEVEVVAWGEGEQSWSMDYKMIPGGPHSAEAWAELDALLLAPWPHASGDQLRILCCLIDSGFESKAVYGFVADRQPRRVFASKGVGGEGRSIYTIRTMGKTRINLITVGTHEAKRIIHSYLRYTERGAPGFCWFPVKPAYNDDYFAQLTAEKLVRTFPRGRAARWEWQKIRPRNEALDCRILAYVALLLLNPHWQDLREKTAAVRKRLLQAGSVRPQPRRRRRVVSEGIEFDE